MYKTAFLGLSVILFILLCSCRLDYGRSLENRELQKDVPDMVIESARFEIVRDKVRSMVLEVVKAEVFASADKRVMTGVSFSQYDPDGTISAKGKAGHAVQGIQSEDVVFSDGLTVELFTQDAVVQADGLEWKSKEKRLQGTAEQLVTITKKSGSTVKGYGFRVDFATRTMELSGGVDGSLVND